MSLAASTATVEALRDRGLAPTPPLRPTAHVEGGESRKGLYNSAALATVLALAGHTLLGFEQSVLQLVVALATGYGSAIFLEWVDAKVNRRRLLFAGGWKSVVLFLVPTHMTSITISFILYVGGALWPMAAIVCLAVASKYIFKVKVFGRSRHYMNPSNFALSAGFFLIPWVNTLPYEYTTFTSGAWDWVVPSAIVMLGTRLNFFFTKRIPLILSWMATFALQAVVRAAIGDVSLVGSLMPFTSVAFLLFSFYMITDPMTSARGLKGQLATGIATGVLYGLITHAHVVFALFFAVTIVCFVRGAMLAWDNAREARAQTPHFAWMR